MASLNSLKAWLAGAALALAGCNSLLGDFKYDPNVTKPGGSGGGPSADEQGNIVILPTAGLITTERGGKATFTVSLKVQPTSIVVIALSSSNEAEGVVSPISVTFTPDNFNAPQLVQVTGVDDLAEDGTQNYTIKTSPATSDDPEYFGLDPLDVQVKNIDDETAGITLLPPSGLLTTESGGEALLGIVLNHAPTADVIIPLSSDNPAEGTVSPAQLTFTPTNWMAPQMVTITGVDDDIADGLQTYHVVTGPAMSADSRYNGFDADDAIVQNQDNDTAGVTLTPATGLMTRENGEMTTFGISLNSPPTSDVRITLVSDDPSEGTAWPDSVVFTPLNWMAPQLITVTGVDDDRADGNQPYWIRTNPAESDDLGYAGHDGPDAAVINIDDDSPGITVAPATGLVTHEMGDAATFTVVLNSKPSGDVLLDVASSNVLEGTVSPTQLVFTEVSWAAPQTVTVTGVDDDDVADGMQVYHVTVTPSTASADAAYGVLLPVDVPVSNTDDDSAGITVVAPTLLTTREWGEAATFTVVLNSKPTADVTIGLTSGDTTEGTVSPPQLVFTPANWSAPQTVTVKGVNDDMQDGDQRYKVFTDDAVSTDPSYSGMVAANVDVSNIDDDTAGFSVWPVNNLLTSENGLTATFQVRLNTEPTADVTIPVSSTNQAEGTVNTAALKFTRLNWGAPQTVTIKGVDDDATADGSQVYRITLGQAISDDANYKLKDPPDVTVTNLDNDQPGILLRNQNNLQTREDGTPATFQIVLQSRPAKNVLIGLSSNKPAEGTVTPALLTFTRDNWAAPQTVTVKGVDDKVADGDQPYRIITAPAQSEDPKYQGIDVADVNVTNLDNDSPGVIVNLPVGGVVTKEPSGTATFTIQLQSQPTMDVTIPLRSSKPTEATVSPSSLLFTAANWNSPRTVTVTGVDDKVADGPQPYLVLIEPASSQDPKYNLRDAADVPATNLDDDSPRITVSPASNDTTEKGMSATFTIVLGSEPKAPVAIPVKSLNTKEGSVSPDSVTFTPLNWNAPQKITITPVDERVQDGDQVYTIDVGVAVSMDAGYAGLDPDDVTLTNIDDDSAGILVSMPAGDTKEDGKSTTFTIVLTSQPTASVAIPISSSDPGEGTPNVASVTFTTTDYNSAKTVTVTGVNDDEVDGDQPYMILLGEASSTDANYSKRDAADVALKNVDDDSAGFTVTPRRGTTGEKASAASFSFTVALTSKPKSDVTVPVSSNDTSEGTVSPTSLVFTPTNWNAAQTITVKGVDDTVQDGDQDYTIVLGEPTTTDADYAQTDPPDVAMSNVDDDMAGIDISPASGPTTETGETATFTIVLRSKPTADVTIPLSSNDETEGTITVDSVTFTPANWNVEQTIEVHGENDKEQDGDQAYKIVTGVVMSQDLNYQGKNPEDVDLLNIDDDMAGIQVSMISGPTTEAGGVATFTVVLTSMPKGLVSIPVSSDDPSEGTAVPENLEFTTSNWSTPQQVVVTGEDDAIDDGDQPYSIKLGKPVTADANYGKIDPPDLMLSNLDDDEPVEE